MDENLYTASDTFRILWERVSGKKTKSGPEEDEFLQEMIRETENTAAFCGQLARMCSTAGKQTLTAHSRELRTQCRSLRLEYFIRNGISYMPEAACPLISGKAMALRSLMLQEKSMADRCGYMADCCPNPAIQELLHSLAAQCRRQSAETRYLLAECFS